MSLGCHKRPFMSRLSWFSCSTGLEPDPGGGAEWEEEEEELNQFIATGPLGSGGIKVDTQRSAMG